MVPVKIVCSCGQKYAFDVEPVNGRMPTPVACPVCGAEGTAAANEILARALPAQPAAAPALSMPVRSAAPAAPAAAPATATPARGVVRPMAERESRSGGLAGLGDGENWKWWYFVLAGLGLGAYDIYKFTDTGRFKWLWELIMPVFCILVGIWDFQRKRRKKSGS